MTEAASRALLSAEAGREGARLTGVIAEQTFAELSQLGLIGPRRGLTMRGVVKRERLREELYADLF